jgi:hypothetical protein
MKKVIAIGQDEGGDFMHEHTTCQSKRRCIMPQVTGRQRPNKTTFLNPSLESRVHGPRYSSATHSPRYAAVMLP